MFCRNCGKEVKEESKFCSFCGEPTNILSKASKQISIQNIVRVDNGTLLHFLPIIISCVIVLLTFSKWITIESWMVSSDFSTWRLIKTIGSLSKYSDTEQIIGFVILLVIFMATVIILSVNYILKAYRAGTQAKSNWHIVYGYSAMLAIAIICFIYAVFTMIIFSAGSSGDYDVVKIYFNEKMYYIIVLACLNRFVLLPKLNKIIYYRDKTQQNDNIEK